MDSLEIHVIFVNSRWGRPHVVLAQELMNSIYVQKKLNDPLS
jgi:hypothetical protein